MSKEFHPTRLLSKVSGLEKGEDYGKDSENTLSLKHNALLALFMLAEK